MITARQHRLLTEESARTGLARSELVRRALDKTYRPHRRPKVRGFELAVSVAKPPDPAGVGRRERLI
jgi:hypothetical protein